MARLIYSAITSLDGYIEDTEGAFDWGVPDEEAGRASSAVSIRRPSASSSGQPDRT